jgi:hypothetical protein
MKTSLPSRSPIGAAVTVIALLALPALLPAPVEAGVVYTAGYNAGETPQQYELSNDWATTGLRQDYRYSLSEPFGLHAVLGVRGRTIDNFFTSISVDDVIVSSSDPGATRTVISFGGDLIGDLLGAGNGAVILDVSIRAQGEARAARGFAFTTNDGSRVATRVEVSADVPLGVPLHVTAQMELRASALIGNQVLLDFANSFDFDPAAVFGVGAGVSVNSASWGLVDNRLAAALAEPGTFAAFAIGLAGLGAARRSACRHSTRRANST